jgi:hypothetical protein
MQPELTNGAEANSARQIIYDCGVCGGQPVPVSTNTRSHVGVSAPRSFATYEALRRLYLPSPSYCRRNVER